MVEHGEMPLDRRQNELKIQDFYLKNINHKEKETETV